MGGSLSLQNQFNEYSDSLPTILRAEVESQSDRQTTTNSGANEAFDDMKQPRTIKATPVKRRSKQLPRLFIATKRLLASTHVTEKEGTKEAPTEMFPLPMSSTFILPFNISNSDSPGLTKSLPDDLIHKVTSFLDVQSLLQVRACSHSLKELASRNEAGWERLCRTLWADKVHVLAGMQKPMPLSRSPSGTTTNLNEELSPDFFMDAYRRSSQDARHRQHVTMDELCYDPGKPEGLTCLG